jgi:hypothetical protein
VNGMLPAGSDLGTTFHGTDLAVVAGQPSWAQLTSSGQLSCNNTAVVAVSGGSPAESLFLTFQSECPEITEMLDTSFGNIGDVNCTDACIDYVSNLGACLASDTETQQVCSRSLWCPASGPPGRLTFAAVLPLMFSVFPCNTNAHVIKHCVVMGRADTVV